MNKDTKFVIFVFLLSVALNLFILMFIPYPPRGGDWFYHTFTLPHQFDVGDWTPPRDRPPLFALIVYSVHKIIGSPMNQYWVSQIISVILSSLYVIPSYFISKKIFSERVSKISTIFMVFVPILIFYTIYTWPKNAAMFGILSMFYLLLFSDYKYRYYLSGLFGGLSFLFHSYSAIYIGTIVLLMVYKKHNIRGILTFIIITIVTIVPYYLWLYSFYGTFSTSRFIYYPFMDVTKAYSSEFISQDVIFRDFFNTPISEMVMTRVVNAAMTLTPVMFLGTNYPTYQPMFYYTSGYSGGLTTLLYVILVFWFVRYSLGKRNNDPTLLLFIFIPIIISVLMYGWMEWGSVGLVLLPTVPLLVMIGINEIMGYPHVNVWISLLISGMVIDNIRMYFDIKGFYAMEGGIINMATMLEPFGLNVSDFVSIYYLFH